MVAMVAIAVLALASVCGAVSAVPGREVTWTYTYGPGAIGAGNDVIPPQNMTRGDAETRCSALPRCQGITYHGSNTTTAVQKVYFKSSTGKSNDPSWSTYLKTGTVTPPAKSLAVGDSGLVLELRDTYFTVQSLNNTAVDQPPAGFGIKPSTYSFTRPLDQGSCLPLSVHLGDLTLRLQSDVASIDPLDSIFYSSAQIAAPAEELPTQGNVLAAQDITKMVAGSAPSAAEASTFPLKIVRLYEKSADGNALVLRFNLTNTASKAVRLDGLGFAMPESPGHPPAGIQETVWNDPHIGGEHGFVEFVRVVDEEATLLVVPEGGHHKSTKLEAWRPMLEDIAGTSAWEWTVHSTAWAAEWRRGAQSPFLNMSTSTQGTPPMFPNAKTPWPSCDGHEGFPILPASKTPWNNPTDRVLKPAETVSFALRLQLAKAGPRTRNEALKSMGEPVLHGVPGYVLGSDMKSAKLLVLPPAGLTVSGANATSIGAGTGAIEVGAMGAQGDYKVFPLRAFGRGRVTVTVSYSDGTTSAAHYMVLPPFTEQASKVSHHYVNDAWLPRETVDPFGRSASMMPWDREIKAHILDDARAYDVGLSDDAGGGNPLGSASRLKASPNQELASRVDDYIKWTLYGIKPDTAKPPLRALQVLDPNGTDHDGNPLPETAYTSGNGKVDTDGIRMTMYYYGPDLGKTPSSGHFEYEYKEADKCDRPFGGPTWCMTESMCNATYRGFNYPHHTSNYWAMYHIARNHENIKTHQSWQWYLERVAKTMMRGAHGGTGYMDGTVYRECLNALIEEGKTNETISEWAVTLNESLHERQQGWTHQAYPYGSEFGFDTTGQEEVVVWNLYYGNDTVAKYTVDHILSYMRSSPTWVYNGGARSWGDAGNNAKWLTSFGTGFGERGQMHYRSGLNMIPLMEWYRTHPDELFLLEVSMGAIAGQLANIDENGATSMMWHAMPYVMDYDPHSGDFGLGFFGHCLETGAYYVLDQNMGELCYLCDVANATPDASVNNSNSDSAVTITPRDSFHNRVFLEPLSVYLYAEAGTIDHVMLDLSGKKLTVVFESLATAGATNWTFQKIRLKVDKTSHDRPGTNFLVSNPSMGFNYEKHKGSAQAQLPFVRGAYEVPPASGGGETAILVTWS